MTASAKKPPQDAVRKAPAPRWKVALFVVAGLLLVAGGLLYAMEEPPPPRPQPPAGTAAAGLVENGGATGNTSASQGEGTWAPGLLRMGFSFFVAFAVGAVLRSFFKLSLLFVGVLALILVGLQQGGFLTIHWDAFENLWGDFTARVEQDFDQLRTMVTGSLPQTGLAGLGLFAGLKKG